MEPRTFGKGSGRRRDAADRTRKARGPVRLIDGRAADRHRWAIAALLFPLFFCAVVGVGVYLMFHRNLGYFKPPPSGLAAPPNVNLALGDAHLRGAPLPLMVRRQAGLHTHCTNLRAPARVGLPGAPAHLTPGRALRSITNMAIRNTGA